MAKRSAAKSDIDEQLADEDERVEAECREWHEANERRNELLMRFCEGRR